MKAYGSTCPLCCGDIEARPKYAPGAVCTFCGAELDAHVGMELLPFLARPGAPDDRPFWRRRPADEKVLPLLEPARGRSLSRASQRAV